MANKRREPRFGSKIKFSIVLKLNARLFLRTFFAFLALDVILCAASAASVFLYAERALGAVCVQAGKSGPPDSGAEQWLRTQGITVTGLSEPMKGFKLPDFLQKMLPDSTDGDVRKVSARGGKTPFPDSLEELSYSIGLNDNGGFYQFSVSLYGIIHPVRLILSVLFTVEIILLLSGLFSNTRMIRRTLNPISELAKAAESLNRASAASSADEMERFAGKLNNIDAAKLDTRIPVESTQRELKTLAVSINGMLDRINESYRSQIRFVSDASHELRTPIAVIQGYANLLDRWGKNDEKTMQESITAIKEETANMKQLVEQLLFLARGDNNTMKLRPETFDLSALAQEVVSETQMIDAGHEYSEKLARAEISADRPLIKQCIRVIMDNAIKYTPAGGHISATVAGADGFARLSVQDDGIGIPAEAVPRIFDRFYRADESRARATGGTGLGLSIAQWIAERHGGHFEVLSRENIGTRITMAIPLHEGGRKE